MSTTLDLNKIERKAFRSIYQDGLWDMHYGAIVAAMAIFMHRPESGYTPRNPLLAVLIISLSSTLFWAGKIYITLPRMGQARFGAIRQRKNKTLAILLGVAVLFQAGLVGLTAMSVFNPELSSKLADLLGAANHERLAVASVAGLMVCIPMLVIAYFSDFTRGYYIALLMSLAVFLMILTNQSVYPLVIGGLILLPGLVIFMRFLKKYPLPQKGQTNG